MPNGKPRIVGYVRVSTEEQELEGYSLDAQSERLTLACEFKGWELVDVVADAVTGTEVNVRPSLKRVLRAIAKGDVDGLIVAKLDRLSRSRSDVDLIFDWFVAARATLCVLDIDGLDTSTAMGQAMLGMHAVMAQLFRDTIAENTKTVLQHKRSKGQRVGRPGVHEIPTLERRIRKLREDGWTYQRIADQLNLDGVPTLRGAALWQVSSVRGAAGYVRPPKRKTKTTLPAIPARRGKR